MSKYYGSSMKIIVAENSPAVTFDFRDFAERKDIEIIQVLPLVINQWRKTVNGDQVWLYTLPVVYRSVEAKEGNK